MRLEERGWEDVDCTYVVQTRNRWKEKKILVSIKCGETDEVSTHHPFRKLNHTQNWNIMCAFIIALFTSCSNKISKKATLGNSRLHMKWRKRNVIQNLEKSTTEFIYMTLILCKTRM